MLIAIKDTTKLTLKKANPEQFFSILHNLRLFRVNDQSDISHLVTKQALFKIEQVIQCVSPKTNS